MNIEQANGIPLTEILERLQVKPEKIRRGEYWYLSPLREEKTASLKVNANKNLWYDFGEGKGGDVVSFVCAYLKSTLEADSVHDALRWLTNMTGDIPCSNSQKVVRQEKEKSRLVLKEISPIEHLLLMRYLKSRGISFPLAERYLKQLRLFNPDTKKSFFTLGFKNEDDGFEARNPFFKGCVGAKSITFIRGANTHEQGVHIFEGCMDFLSALEQQERKALNDDAIVLNSLSCFSLAIPYINNYGYRIGYTWLDNDKAGAKTSAALAEFFKSQNQLKYKPMNTIYAPHKDVNAWHMHKLGLEG